jgi:hypothetical protein
MKLKRKYVALAGSVAAALAAALFLAPGTANASADQCPNGYLCVWEHKDFSGRILVVGGDMADLFTPMSGIAGTTTWNDQVSSVWNRSNKFGGTSMPLPSGQGYSFVGSFNDKASSIRWSC